MGTVIDCMDLHGSQNVYRLLVYAEAPPEIEALARSLNKPLAEALLKVRPSRRTMQLEKCFVKLLEEMPDSPVVKDIDVMFNPEYQVDVMKILISAFKRKPYSLIWPGTFSEGKLIYGETGYADYSVYNISDYDIVCVI